MQSTHEQFEHLTDQQLWQTASVLRREAKQAIENTARINTPDQYAAHARKADLMTTQYLLAVNEISARAALSAAVGEFEPEQFDSPDPMPTWMTVFVTLTLLAACAIVTLIVW